jgi:hypothetical protein
MDALVSERDIWWYSFVCMYAMHIYFHFVTNRICFVHGIVVGPGMCVLSAKAYLQTHAL